MAICSTSCAPTLPTPYSTGCSIVPRKGGIKRFIFTKCDFEIAEPETRASWDTALQDGDAVMSGLIVGQKPKGSFTKKRFASCAPEATTGATKTITFQDYNSSATCLIWDFWNDILAAPSKYLLWYQLCDNSLYGPINSFDLELDEVHEDTSEGNSFFDGTITFQGSEMICPVNVDLDGLPTVD